MNTTTTDLNPSHAFILDLKKKIEAINESGRATFIGITYTAKGTGETARHVLNLGVSYLNAVRKALAELDTLSREGLSGLEIEALDNVIASYKNTLDNAEKGKKNDVYTKKDVYLDICPGLKMNLNDYSLELHAMSVSKKVITPGKEKKPTVSRPLTIAQDKFKKGLAVSKYRSFCLDVGCLDSVRIGGDELEVL
jgi:hypothetical protein